MSHELLDHLTEKHSGQSLRILRRLLAYFSGHWPMAVLLTGLVASTSLLSTYPILLIKQVVDISSHQEPGGVTRLVVLSLVFLLLKLLGVVTTRALETVSAWVEGHLGHHIRMQAFDHAQMLSLNFYESHRTGELLLRLIGDAEVTVQGFLAPVTSIARCTVEFALLLYFMVSMNWQLTVLGLPFGIVAGVLVVHFGSVFRQRQELARQATDRLWSRLVESLRGMRDIQANNQQSNVDAQLRDVSALVRARTMSANLINSLSGGVNDAIFMFTIASVLLLGGYWTWHGQMSLGTLTAFMMYAHMLVSPVGDLASLYRQLQRIIVSAERIFEIFDHVPTVLDRPNAVAISTLKGDIEFRSISFEYGPDRDILQDVSLHIVPGSRVALVGPSGGGKTTIVKLLARFYDPTTGQILIDGMDLRDMCLDSLRSHLGILFQDIFLFDGTLDANIRFGRTEASAEEMQAVVRGAALGELIDHLPKGLDTMVGENGVKLSAGERQRVGLARVLIKCPSIVILDEPDSSLDTLSTAEIMSRLAEDLNQCTMLIVTHQLATTVDADLIVVLCDGRIVEQGTHEHLYTVGGMYRSMYDAQFCSQIAQRVRVQNPVQRKIVT